MILEKAPGKLYIAGEYAVIEKNCPAIIVAINEFVYASIEKTDSNGTIYSKQYSNNSVEWTRKNNELVIDNRDNPFHYILSAIKYTEQYVCENGGQLEFFDLKINSELDSEDGKKYGLGSSAAVTVATVKALLKFYQMPADNYLIYKLAAIAHFSVQGNGSLGDIAASVFGGWLAYQTFDKDWLKEKLTKMSLTALVQQKWPNLKVTLLTPPADLQLLIGWSQQPALTARLVDQTSEEKADNQKFYQEFLQASQACVNKMIMGFEQQDLATIMAQIRVNRELLQQLAQMSNVQIEIPKLTKLIEIAEHNHGAAKTSGAGNGDCGIVIAGPMTNIDQMKAEWLENGILPLDFKVHSTSQTNDEIK